jgi:hypothetical protein
MVCVGANLETRFVLEIYAFRRCTGGRRAVKPMFAWAKRTQRRYGLPYGCLVFVSHRTCTARDERAPQVSRGASCELNL